MTSSDRDLAAECDAIYNHIEENQRIAKAAFYPSQVIERTMLQVMGGWEHVVEEVRFLKYVIQDIPEKPTMPDYDNPARDMRRLCRTLKLRVPDTFWTAECKAIQQMRNDLGHMLHITAVEGDAPNRSVTFLRVPYRQPDEMTMVEGWARHGRIKVTQTEQQLIEALTNLRWLRDSCFAIRKFGMEFGDWADDRSIESVAGILPWWLPEWGEPGCRELFMRDLRAKKP